MRIIENARSCINAAPRASRMLTRGLVAVVAILGLATSAVAQQTSGSIRGEVYGADAGVTVEVVNEGTGVSKSESPDASGAFRIDGLQPGS